MCGFGLGTAVGADGNGIDMTALPEELKSAALEQRLELKGVTSKEIQVYWPDEGEQEDGDEKAARRWLNPN